MVLPPFVRVTPCRTPRRRGVRGRTRAAGGHAPAAWSFLLPCALPVAVLVVAAEPELPAVALVAALGHPVQDRVVAHQELHPAPGGRIGLVDGAVLERKGAHRRRLGE